MSTYRHAPLTSVTPLPPTPATDEPPVRRPLLFVTVGMALLMMALDGTIVATALPALQQGLGTTVNWAAWTITAYSLGFVLMLPLSGRLSERLGRRRVFLGSVATFTLASLLCGMSDNIVMLVILRALQAAGGAGFTPSATGIIVDHFGDARDRAVSMFGSIFPIGAMIGPIFGGLFVTYWSWRGVFFVNIPIGAVILVMALRYIPADPPVRREAGGRFDLIGMALLGCGLVAGMLAASVLGAHGARPQSVAFVLPAVIAIGAFWLFFRHIRRVPSPFIPPGLISGANFGPVNLLNAIFGGFTMGAMALVPLYAQSRYGLGALDAGTLLIAQGIATIMLSVTAALALRRTGHRLPIYAGTLVIVAGLVLLSLAPAFGLSPYAWLALAAFLVGLGSGTINPASRNAGLQLAPEHSSTLAALRSLFLQVGAIVSVSVVTATVSAAPDPAAMQAWSYAAIALLLVCMLPLVRKIPEHHGAW